MDPDFVRPEVCMICVAHQGKEYGIINREPVMEVIVTLEREKKMPVKH